MFSVRPAEARGRANFNWLDSRHTFSFGDYFDPGHMGFGPLRVINEDTVAPGKGFGQHGHRDMEIISYVLDGALEHKDSLGTGSIIRPGDVQRLSAGSGVQHSEFNASDVDPVHFLQIWVMPDQQGLAPGYEQISVAALDKQAGMTLIGSPDGRDGSVTIHQDVNLYCARLRGNEEVVFQLRDRRLAWIQVARGQLTVNGLTLSAGDGGALDEAGELRLVGSESAEILLFDMGQ